MPKYKSYKSVSLSEPIVCSFTIGSESCSYDLELLDSNLNTITSLSVSSDYDFVEGSNSNHILLSEDNQLSLLDFPSIPDKSKAIIISNYGNELFGNKITIVKKSSLAALSSDYKTNENGDIILNDNSYCPVIIYDDNGKKAYTEYHFNNNEAFTDGAALFVNTSNTDNVLELFYQGIDAYVLDSSFKIIPSIAAADDYAIVLDSQNDYVLFLVTDYELLRDIEKNPLSKFVSSSNEEFYSTNLDMAKNEHRARFVITDNGRIITYAVYNTDKKQFDNIKSFIYPNKIKGEVYLSLNLKQNDYIKDITTNF